MVISSNSEGKLDPMVEGRYVIRTDAHCHILPGVDDGAWNVEASIDMARKAASAGVKNIVATPHTCHPLFPAFRLADEVRAMAADLNRHLRLMEIPVTIHPGMEVFADHSIPELLEAGRLLTWADQGEYLLIELGFYECEPCSNAVIDYLLSKGITPLVAHPERYHWVQMEPERIQPLIDRGCAFQLNVMSLTGRWGAVARAAAFNVMQRCPRWIVGSDAHNSEERFWEVREVRSALQRAKLWTRQGGPRGQEGSPAAPACADEHVTPAPE